MEQIEHDITPTEPNQVSVEQPQVYQLNPEALNAYLSLALGVEECKDRVSKLQEMLRQAIGEQVTAQVELQLLQRRIQEAYQLPPNFNIDYHTGIITPG